MNDQELKAERIKKAVQSIRHHAQEIYNFLELGDIVTIDLPDKSVIALPNQPRSMHRLVIIKPMTCIKIDPK